MSRKVVLGPIIDQFPIYELDGVTKHSGGSPYTVTIWKDGVEQAIAYTITEIGASGEYKIEFTPDEVGFWVFEVIISYNTEAYVGEYEVYESDPAETLFNAAYDSDTSTLYLEAWLERNGVSVPAGDLVSCQVDVYQQDGSLLVSSTSLAPRANGRFSLSEVVLLTDDRPYNVSVSVTDTTGEVTTYHAFTTVQG
jgi:hypothetical protein